jgi:two-component system OmpR family sensor kinase
VKLSQSSRIGIVTIIFLTIFSVGIGSVTVRHSRDEEIKKVDRSLNFIAQSALNNPDQAVGASLYAIEQSTIDATLALLTDDGTETIINESSLNYTGAPTIAQVKRATFAPISISADIPYRVRTLELQGGDFIIIARGTSDINKTFASNVRYLVLVTLLLDSIAGILLLLYFRRERRRSDLDSLTRMQEFLGDASHELRTPLTVIKGYVEMLSKDQLPEAEARSRAFARVHTEINRMESLIQDLLLLAELGESATRDIERMNLSDSVQAHGADFLTLNADRDITLAIEPDIEIKGSHDYISRFIQNALNNIVRHTHNDAPVRISLLRKGKSAYLIIEDGGPGLPEHAYRENIRSLNRFDQSRSRDNGGSGLGMSIMSAVIEKLDGSFSLRKSELGGLAIVAVLPQL